MVVISDDDPGIDNSRHISTTTCILASPSPLRSTQYVTDSIKITSYIGYFQYKPSKTLRERKDLNKYYNFV